MALKIGELAKQTGLTVRTLHHYDDIGLLRPSHRSEAGYRLYSLDDLARLHQIQALKQLGFALAEIGDMLATHGAALPALIVRQLAALDEQIEQTKRLRTQLLLLQAKVGQGDEPEVADWLTTLELMTMYDKYFSPDELQALEKHRLIENSEQDRRWPDLVAAVRGLMQAGVAPDAAEAQQRVIEWTALAEETVGNDIHLLHKLGDMTRKEPTVQAQSGIDNAMLDYVMAGRAARQRALYVKYLTPEELEQVMRGREKTGAHWPPLVAAMRKKFAAGAAIDDAEVRELATRWKELFDITHAGSDGVLLGKLRIAYAQEPELLRGTGLDLPLLGYVGRAMAAL